MPEYMSTLVDHSNDRCDPQDALPPEVRENTAPDLPGSAWRAILRGAMARCPRCAEGRLFRRFLKPVDRCDRCDQDWSLQSADDFPAYVSIFVTGHIMAPIIIALVNADWLSTAALGVLIVSLSMVLMLASLQPAKGAIIALQWWFRMHGFRRE